MFGSGFSLGFTMSDVTTQVSAFLGNVAIVGLIAVSLALITIPQIISVVRRIQYGGWAQYVEDLRGGDELDEIHLADGEVMLPGEHMYGMADGSSRRLNSDDWEEV